MLTDFLSKINWIDVGMVVIIFRVIFIGLKNGIITEFFKLLGTIFSAFILLHYFINLAGIFPSKFNLSEAFIYAFSFCILWALITFIFKLLRDGLMLIFSIETHKGIDRWGGGVLASFRALIVCGLVFYLLILVGLGTDHRMAKTSISRRCFGPVAPGIYQMIFDGFVSKFFTSERLNNKALSISRLLDKRS